MTTTSSIGRTPYETTFKKLCELKHGDVFQTISNHLTFMMIKHCDPESCSVSSNLIYIGEGRIGNYTVPVDCWFGENWDHIQVELLDCHIHVAGK